MTNDGRSIVPRGSNQVAVRHLWQEHPARTHASASAMTVAFGAEQQCLLRSGASYMGDRHPYCLTPEEPHERKAIILFINVLP
jgi:hypothetical protein